MRKFLARAAIVAVSAGIFGCGQKEAPESVAKSECAPQAAPTFAAIAKNLQYGGESFEVLCADEFRSDVKKFFDLVASIDGVGEIAPQAFQVLDRIGLLSPRGCGSSVVRVSDAVYEHRSFLLMDSGKVPVTDILLADGAQAVEDYLPAKAQVVLSGAVDVKSLLTTCRGCLEVLGPEVREAGERCLEQFGLIEGVGRGTAVAVTFDPDIAWEAAPLGIDAKKGCPKPGLLLVQKLDNASLWTYLKFVAEQFGACKSKKHPDFDDVSMLVMSEKDMATAALGMDPVVAFDQNRQLLFFASDPLVLTSALVAGRSGKGRLLQSETFVKASGNLADHEALFYVSPKFVSELARIARVALPREARKEAPAGILKYLDEPPEFWLVAAASRRDDGVFARARASFGACSTLRLLQSSGFANVLASAGMLAGAAVPNFVRSRNCAQQNACLSNLKQIEAAKEQCLLAGKEATEENIYGSDKYIRQKLRCPAGGTYTLGGEDESPRCSVHGGLPGCDDEE